MFTSTGASTSLATPTASPASPTRPSRLRGLSYLRNYTQNHLSRDSPNSTSSASRSLRPLTLARSTSYPTPSTTPATTRSNLVSPPARSLAPDPSLSSRSPATEVPATVTGIQDSSTTSGWLPGVGGQSGVSRVTARSSVEVNANEPVEPREDDTTTPMTRARSATTSGVATSIMSPSDGRSADQAGSLPAELGQGARLSALPSIRFTQYQDVRAPRPSLVFSPVSRTLPTGSEVIRVGRYSEREALPNPAPSIPSGASVGFKSKVVSRRHCEFWSEDGTWYIKDVKSSSGTFLNHVRLSSPGSESKPFAIKDGDLIQLGIDFKGGEEMIFRCVKIRIELNRNWQNSLNNFNVASHKRLRNMAKLNASPASPSASSSQDCSICLGAVAPCQSLFVAPCSHTWHYKCVRRIINGPMWPQFVCPNCRAVADLEAEVDEPDGSGEWEEAEEEPEEPKAEQQPLASVVEPDESNASSAAADIDDEVYHVINDMEDLNLGRDGEADVQPRSISRPVDIRAPRPTGLNSGRAENAGPFPGPMFRTDRTPSPSGRPMPADIGPMTPRNDAGPFVFDGSAGRASDTPLTTISLAAVATDEIVEQRHADQGSA